MPELRKDPIDGRWVIIATERARRPGNIVDSTQYPIDTNKEHCPYCKGDEKPIYTHGNIKVIPYRAVQTDLNIHRVEYGLYEILHGTGVYEIVVETDQHIANMADFDEAQIREVLKTYAARMHEFSKNSDLKYILAYKNHGISAGSRNVGHARSHVIATPVNPLRVKEKLIGAKEYFEAQGRCIYCDLIKQEVEAKVRIVYETEHFLAIVPFAARFLFELKIG